MPRGASGSTAAVDGRRRPRSIGMPISASAASSRTGRSHPFRFGRGSSRIAGPATKLSRWVTVRSGTAWAARRSPRPAWARPLKSDATGPGSFFTNSPRCWPSSVCSLSGPIRPKLRPSARSAAPVAPPSSLCADSVFTPLVRATASASGPAQSPASASNSVTPSSRPTLESKCEARLPCRIGCRSCGLRSIGAGPHPSTTRRRRGSSAPTGSTSKAPSVCGRRSRRAATPPCE